MKFPALIALPVLVASCSDLTPKDQDDPAPSPKTEKVKTPKVTEGPDLPPPTSEPTIEGFTLKDPDTTGELMTEDKKKTVTGPETLSPVPSPEPDNGIKVSPPKLPEVKIPEEE